MMAFSKWISWCLLSICVIQITCAAALPTSGAHDLDELVTHDQQAIASSASKPSPLQANRVFNRAIRGSQPNIATPRSNPQQKSQPLQPKSTSTLPPIEDSNEENEEQAAESQADPSAQPPQEEESSSTTTSTEGPRKPFSGAVRPFRSNKDLLDSLKRRRQMLQQHGYTVVPPTPSSTTEKVQTKNSGTTRKNNNLNKSTTYHESNSLQKKSTTPTRRHNVKPAFSTTPSNNDAITEENNVVSQPSRSSRTYPKTRRIS